MEQNLYMAILVYFLLGAAAFAYISRNKDRNARRAIWTKYISYLLIIHTLFASIYFGPHIFTFVGAIIVTAGVYELIRTHLTHGGQRSRMFLASSMLLYLVFAFGFLRYTSLEKELLYFVFFIVTVFDAFSQISGQLIGGTKLWPSISPAKTISGTVGGGTLALITASVLAGIIGTSLIFALFFALIIVIFALSGDLLASFYKRHYGVKDFSHFIPGHGGFLDRFDSLIPGGAAMYIINCLL